MNDTPNTRESTTDVDPELLAPDVHPNDLADQLGRVIRAAVQALGSQAEGAGELPGDVTRIAVTVAIATTPDVPVQGEVVTSDDPATDLGEYVPHHRPTTDEELLDLIGGATDGGGES